MDSSESVVNLDGQDPSAILNKETESKAEVNQDSASAGVDTANTPDKDPDSHAPSVIKAIPWAVPFLEDASRPTATPSLMKDTVNLAGLSIDDPLMVQHAAGEKEPTLPSVVGTLTIIPRTAFVWVGWGGCHQQNAGGNLVSPSFQESFGAGELHKRAGSKSACSGLAHLNNFLFLSATRLPMGPLVVAMPRATYARPGVSSASAGPGGQAAVSKLVGSDCIDDEMLASNMAQRLSAQSGRRVFVSCSLVASSPTIMSGAGFDVDEFDPTLRATKAAALAEREVFRLLQLEEIR
jgi:Proteasome assembly chaperone 4